MDDFQSKLAVWSTKQDEISRMYDFPDMGELAIGREILDYARESGQADSILAYLTAESPKLANSLRRAVDNEEAVLDAIAGTKDDILGRMIKFFAREGDEVK